jgi:hypothetical protein
VEVLMSKPARKPTPAQERAAQERAAQQRLIDAWKHPVGTAVVVTKDDGRYVRTTTRGAPWLMGDVAVIMLEGISGGYALERVRALRDEPDEDDEDDDLEDESDGVLDAMAWDREHG